MKKTFVKILAVICAFFILLPATAFAQELSGSCGATATYQLSGDDTNGYSLTISGTGAMTDYNSFGENIAPWTDKANLVKSITISEGITTIGEDAFINMTNLASLNLPESLTTIGDFAFQNCSKLTTVNIPKNVTSIAEGKSGCAFINCTGITQFTVATDNATYSSDANGVLFNKDKTTLIQYPASNSRTTYTLPNETKVISYQGFAYSENLTTINLHANLDTLNTRAFYQCTNLTAISIPSGINEIPYETFENCTSLEDVTLLNSGVINQQAFQGCTSLQVIDIPEGIISLQDNAFTNCTNLTTVNLPTSLQSIKEGCFANCGKLANITLNDTLLYIGPDAFKNCANITTVNIPTDIQVLGDNAFNNCSGITKFTVSEDCIPYSADANGVLFDKDKTTLIAYPAGRTDKSYTIPETVTVIQEDAFKGNNLTEVNFNGTKEEIANLNTTGLNPSSIINTNISVPTAVFNANGADSGTLTNVTNLMEYSIDGGASWQDITGTTMTIPSGLNVTNGIEIRVKETSENFASDVQKITLSKGTTPAPNVSNETIALDDGKITNVDATMEYKKATDSQWTDCNGTEISVGAINDDTSYQIRVKANGTALAGNTVEATVKAYVPKKVTINELEYDITAVDYNSLPQGVTVKEKGNNNYLGEICIKYNGTTLRPTNANTYPIKVDVTGNERYLTTNDILLGNFIINRIDYTGTKVANDTIYVSGGAGKTIELPALPEGGSFGTPTSTGDVNLSNFSITGNTLSYDSPEANVLDSGEITIPVVNCTNYNDYNVVVTISYKALEAQDISYATKDIYKTNGAEPFTNELTKTVVNGNIIYTSSNPKVATIDANGLVTIIGTGNTVITATAEKTGSHNEATAIYNLSVGIPMNSLFFNTYGGTEIPNITAAPGTLINLANYVPTKANATFDGWYLDTKFTEKVTEIKLDRTTILHANWINATLEPVEEENYFLDVPKDSYYAEAVKWAVENNITEGTSKTLFSPNLICTRAQAITFLYRSAGAPKVENKSQFVDIPNDAYYADAVSWGLENGITKGISETEFAPDKQCTRAEIVTFLHRLAITQNITEEIELTDFNFVDINANAFYADAVQWAVENNITEGISKTLFAPNDLCNRGQMVTFLYRNFNNVK